MEKYLNIDSSTLGYFLQIKCPQKGKKEEKKDKNWPEEIFEVTK